MAEGGTKADDDGSVTTDGILRTRGRNRICKLCKFTCTDSKEFFHHQMNAHSEAEDTVSKKRTRVPSLSAKGGKHDENKGSESEPNMSSSQKFVDDAMSRENSFTEDEEDRLIIAEEDSDLSSSLPPTRSGNIQNRTYVCCFCDYTSTNAKAFLHHQNDEHDQRLTIYECDVCDYATKYKQKLPRHRKLHFSGNESLLQDYQSPQEFMLQDGAGGGDSMTEQIANETLNDEEDYDGDEDDHTGTDEAAIVVEQPIAEKKKAARQEVDPAKYFEVVDDSGIKYSCSKCGNVYKWRKSLNKHWKEKHFGEIPDASRKPKGLVYLNVPTVKQNGRDGNMVTKFLLNESGSLNNSGDEFMQFNKSINDSSRSSTPYRLGTPVPPPEDVDSVMIPHMIGPFITNSSQPIFPEMMLKDIGNKRSHPENSSAKIETVKRKLQDEPIDFSVKKDTDDMERTTTPDYSMPLLKIKSEPTWGHDSNCSDLDPLDPEDFKPAPLQCTKCAFVAKTLIDYSAHMTIHFSKRAFKCAECQEHFTMVEDLNKHFIDTHSNKIQEHKDALQKIPHGLQQTYHLLKMPLNKLSTMASLEFAAGDNKQLNCSLCSFVAKWPAELQKHAVSHSEERPFICMVCGSTYKWKWDLVKHFEKSHHGLPNPYKRREMSGGSGKTAASQVSKTTAALLDDVKDNRDEPAAKKRRMSDTDLMNMEKMADINRYDEEGMDCYQGYDPNNNEDTGKKYLNPEDDMFSQIQITNVQSLINEGDSHDEDDDFNPVDETYSCTLVSADIREKLSLALKSNRPKLTQNDANESSACADILLPFKCNICEYRARWPSEITQHMKNHSDEKPYCCPQCSYRSKWKWDVVKHMKRCGGGSMGVKDVIDRSKMTPPPNAVVIPNSNKIASSQPVAYLLGTMAAVASTGQKIALIPVSNAPSTTIAANPVTSNPGLVSALKHGIDPKNISKPAPIFRSLVNISQGLCHCLECPFVGLSPAELKRHSFLHSEAKPFTCNACGYSSRWKCDLKKHKKTYNHGSMSPDSNKSPDKSDSEDMAAAEKEHDNISVNRMLYKCTKCSFGTHNRNLFESHHKMHELGENSAKFRCKQCDYKADDLSSFLQHKVSHTSQQQLVPLTSILSRPAEEVSTKSIHMKHRRKPVKQFCCTKCPYSCFKRSGLALHSAMHEPRGSEAVKCLYCDYNVYSKNLVIQHMRLHPEYEANETAAADSDKCKEIMEAEEKYDTNMNNMFNNLNTEANAAPVPVEPQQHQPQILPQSIPIKPKGKFPCEWCPAAFPHVSHLYQHSKLLHPLELAAQENAGQSNNSEEVVMPMIGMSAIMAPKPTPPPLQSPKAINLPLAPKMASVMSMMKAKKSTSPQKKLGRQLACSKCSFVGTSPFTYLRHMDRHGSKSRHTCLYCDYSIDRLNLLYQHMKSTHGALSHKALTTEKAFERAQNKVSPIRMMPDGRHVEKKMERSPMEIAEQNSIHLNGSLTEAQMSKIISQDSTAWKANNKGFSPDGMKKNYDCPKCDYSSNNPANTEHHVRQHGAKRRYKCEQCDYSVDNLRLVYNHIATVHQGNFPVMENLNSGSTGQVQQLSASKLLKILPQESDEPRKAEFMENVNLQQRSTNYYNCPKCPYKLHMSKGYRLFMRHREHHGYNGHFKCQQCDYSSDKLKVLYAHKKVHLLPPNVTQQKPEEKPSPIGVSSKFTGRIRYRCSKCPYNTMCKSNIIKHRRQHLHKGRFKCELCNYSAARMYLLDNHMKFHDKKHLQTSHKQEVFQDIILDPFAENCLQSLDEMESNLKNQGKLIADGAAPSHDNYSPIRKGHDNYSPIKKGHENYSPIRKGADIMRRHRCLHCPFESLSMSDVRKHSHFHEGSRRYGCQFCNYSVDRQNLLTRHQRVHGIKTSYVQPLPECHLLSMDTGDRPEGLYRNSVGKAEPDSTSEIYRMKIVNNSVTKRHMCSLCPFSSNSLNSYNIHSQMHGLDRKYVCDYCNWSAGRMNLLTQHRYVHAGEPNFNTYRDERVFLNDGTNKEKLATSPVVVDNVVVDNNVAAVKGRKFKKTYSCKLCPYTSMNKQSYTYHRLLHSIRAKYTCSVCSYSNGQWKQMNSHMGLHRAKEPGSSVVLSKRGRLRCPHCPYTSTKRKLLDVHAAMHASGRKHRCEFCNFSTDRVGLLQHHQRVHTADSEDDDAAAAYPCGEDDKKAGPDAIAPQLYFSAPEDDLDEDSSDVEEQEELNCGRCPYSTPTKTVLERHESQHAGPGELACPYCDYGCDAEEGLLAHVQIHFPSSKLDDDTLQSLIKKQRGKKQTVRRELVQLQGGDEKKEGENGPEEEAKEAASAKTKVYVCQYCEREYEGKVEMQKHEKQHLVGYQY